MTRHLLWKHNELLKRKLFLKKKILFFLIRNIKRSAIFSFFHKSQSYFLIQHIFKSYYCSKTYHLCLITGRTHNILKKFKCSRFVLRFHSYKATLPGLSRAS